MFKILLASFIILTSLRIEAVQIKIESYSRKELPKKYRELRPVDGTYRTIITLEEWPLDRKISVTESDLLGSEKTYLIDTQEINLLFVDSLGYIPGCPVTFTFTDSKDKKLREEVTIVPNPLYVKSAVDDAKIEAILGVAHPAAYVLQCTGFDKAETILFESCSYDEQLEGEFQVSTQLSLMPGVINKEGGIARLKFTRPFGEVLKMELPWGWEWMKYLLYSDDQGKVTSIIETDEFLQENPKIAQYFKSVR